MHHGSHQPMGTRQWYTLYSHAVYMTNSGAHHRHFLYFQHRDPRASDSSNENTKFKCECCTHHSTIQNLISWPWYPAVYDLIPALMQSSRLLRPMDTQAVQVKRSSTFDTLLHTVYNARPFLPRSYKTHEA